MHFQLYWRLWTLFKNGHSLIILIKRQFRKKLSTFSRKVRPCRIFRFVSFRPPSGSHFRSLNSRKCSAAPARKRRRACAGGGSPSPVSVWCRRQRRRAAVSARRRRSRNSASSTAASSRSVHPPHPPNDRSDAHRRDRPMHVLLKPVRW